MSAISHQLFCFPALQGTRLEKLVFSFFVRILEVQGLALAFATNLFLLISPTLKS
jgi:hypothetical protein